MKMVTLKQSTLKVDNSTKDMVNLQPVSICRRKLPAFHFGDLPGRPAPKCVAGLQCASVWVLHQLSATLHSKYCS